MKRQELKRPDQFVTFWGRVGNALAQRWKVLVSLLVTVFVVLVGMEVARNRTTEKRAVESQALARIEAVATATLLEEGADAEAAPVPADKDLPRFKTDAERKQAAIKEVDKFLADFPAGRLRSVAELLKARYQASLDNNVDALALYRRLASDDGLSPDLRIIAQEGLAYALEASGKVDDAIAALDTLAERAANLGDFYRDRALYNKGRLLENRGQAAQAIAIYREVVDKYPTSALRDEINDRMATLESTKTSDVPDPASPDPAGAPAAGGEGKTP